MSKWVVLLLVLGACRQEGETVRFGCLLADEAGVIEERRRMVWGVDRAGSATWTRAYDAAVTAALQVEMVAGSPGPELVFATGRFGIGKPGDVSQLILIDLFGRQLARCRPDRLVEPPVSIERPVDPFYLHRVITPRRLKKGTCRGETVVLCGATATTGWCLALALAYREGRFVPIAAVWNWGSVGTMTISDSAFVCAGLVNGGEYPQPVVLMIAPVRWDGVSTPPARQFAGDIRGCWAVVFPKGSGDVPDQCTDLAIHERTLTATLASRHRTQGASTERRPICRVVLDLHSRSLPQLLALNGSNSAQVQAYRSGTRVLQE